MKTFHATLLATLIILAGCTTDSRNELLATDASAVQLRNIQSRVYDSTDQQKLVRTAIATLQDLGFVIDKADGELGTVSATKLDGYDLKMTVNVRARGSKQSVVRANAEYNAQSVNDPIPYQRFFEAYSKALFLVAHNVD